jgi:hypothetical protein
MKTTPVQYFGNSPYRTSRVMRFVEELAGVTHKGEQDFLFIEPYSIGDAIHTLGLLPKFRDIYCEPGQRIVMLCQERAMGLAPIMPYADAMFGLNLSPYELQLEYVASLSNGLSPHLPIICAPDMHALGKVGRTGVGPIQAKKSLFFLEQHEPWAGPVISDDLRRAAEARMAGLGLARGGGLLVIPHANAFHNVNPHFWSLTVALLRGRYPDLRLFTDTTGGGEPIEGTEAVTLTLAELIPAVEYMGRALVLRSGLADLLAHTQAEVVSMVPPLDCYRYAPQTVPQSEFHVRAWFPDASVTDITVRELGLDAAESLVAAFADTPVSAGAVPCM